MYYEAREQFSHPVSGPAEAVAAIHYRRLGDCRCPIWTDPATGRRFALVNDGHIDHAWLEVAVIELTTGQPIQIESLTVGWMDTEAEKLRYVLEAVTGSPAMSRPTVLSLDGSLSPNTVTFECSCCGEHFRSTIAEQKTWDRDAGYGICPLCAPRQ